MTWYDSNRIPEGESGNVKIQKYTVDELHMMTKAAMTGSDDIQKPGIYLRLMIDDEVMMSNNQMEFRTNLPFLTRAHGRILIAGLGLGLLPDTLRDDPRVTEIIIVEKNPHVIKLVAPYVTNPKVRVVESDIFEYKPEGVFNVIYFDIWPVFNPTCLPDMNKLRAKFEKYLDTSDPHRWINSWRYHDIKAFVRGIKHDKTLQHLGQSRNMVHKPEGSLCP